MLAPTLPTVGMVWTIGDYIFVFHTLSTRRLETIHKGEIIAASLLWLAALKPLTYH
jgi:hypothetical protein